jgi:hypothetical protein
MIKAGIFFHNLKMYEHQYVHVDTGRVWHTYMDTVTVRSVGSPARRRWRATLTRQTDGRRGNRRRASRPDRAQELSTSPLLRTAQVGAATARPMADLLINRIGASADRWSASCPRPGPAEISPPGPPFAWRATRRRIDRPARARSPLRSSRKQKLTRRRPGRRFRRKRRATCPVLIITLARRSGLETAGPAGVEVRRVLYMASPCGRVLLRSRPRWSGSFRPRRRLAARSPPATGRLVLLPRQVAAGMKPT